MFVRYLYCKEYLHVFVRYLYCKEYLHVFVWYLYFHNRVKKQSQFGNINSCFFAAWVYNLRWQYHMAIWYIYCNERVKISNHHDYELLPPRILGLAIANSQVIDGINFDKSEETFSSLQASRQGWDHFYRTRGIIS